MGLGVIISLVIIAVVLFLAVKQGWISDRTFNITIGVAGVVGALAAAAVFIIPPAISSESTDTPTTEPIEKPADTSSSTITYLSGISPREISAAGDNYCIGYDPQPAGDTVSCGTVPIILQGQRYLKSLFAHANSTLIFDLNGKYSFFVSSIFLFGSACGDGATFRIELDGKEIYSTPVIKHGDLPRDLRLDVSGGYVLRLETFNGESGDWKCDGTVWGEPYLISK